MVPYTLFLLVVSDTLFLPCGTSALKKALLDFEVGQIDVLKVWQHFYRRDKGATSSGCAAYEETGAHSVEA
jgi:hypothetical protein